jgi:hypothetical protein
MVINPLKAVKNYHFYSKQSTVKFVMFFRMFLIHIM